MDKIAVIIPYFGKFKPSFKLFYESCRRNPKIDWFIFSDDIEPENSAENVKWIYFKLEDFNNLAGEKLNEKINIKYPYKVCDFRPAFGIIFEDYIIGYDFWGYGDADVIYGDILNFLKKINYNQYDKINYAGHFSLMKNVPEINALYQESVAGTKNFNEIISIKNVAYDERDINKKFVLLNKKIYCGIFAADIVFEKGMQCVEKKAISKCFDIEIPTTPKNYRYQLFVSENGRIYRYYKRFGKLKKDEFCYIHYRKELQIRLKDVTENTFVISEKGFCDIKNLDKKILVNR